MSLLFLRNLFYLIADGFHLSRFFREVQELMDGLR